MTSLNPTIAVSLFAVFFGLSAAAIVLLIGRAVAVIPPEDRRYKDAPPLAFRLVWWPIQWFSHPLARVVSQAPTSALSIRLRKAGLEYSISAPQFVAARLLCALAVAGLVCRILSWLAQGTTAGSFSAAIYWEAGTAGAVCGWGYMALWLKDRIALRKSLLQKSLPFYLDLITLCVEAGLNLQGAFNQAVDKGPQGVLREELQRVLRDIRNGKARAEALRTMSERVQEPSVNNFITAMIQAERMGMNLGPVLRAQADQRRSERFLRAEKLAMEAPVKLLFPLIAFIFPCTFIVLFFPIVVQFMHSGL
jgi:tight adherence protein C